jgi:alkanesulfonate monooxygenase SsuD/methylene tetrahydromethanopterin reductase-like flavin-dependent oxidoreductase (luciferase family)
MDIGVAIPQGYFGEYAGWEPRAAWRRSVELAQQADRLGFDSAWTYDHVHTAPDPTDELTWESCTALAAIAAGTHRIRVGQLVLYAGFRHPAIVAAMATTIDAISGGRMELAMGAGWRTEEALAYGFGFPPPAERLATLDRSLAWMRERVGGRIPIIVGGNGSRVTWRLAARHADELNLNLLDLQEVAEGLPTIRARCEEIGRDPATLRVSLQVRGVLTGAPGAERIDRIAAYQALGLARLVVAIQAEAVASDEALASLADDARAAGARLDPGPDERSVSGRSADPPPAPPAPIGP